MLTRRLWLAVALIAWVGVPTTQTHALPPLRISVVDVGQGDGVLIQSPSGQSVVYDAGEMVTGMRNYLIAHGVTDLTLAVASHNHADHIGGLAEVIRVFHPLFYMDNGVLTATRTFSNVLLAFHAVGSQRLDPTARRIQLGDVTLQVIPPPGIAEWGQNDNSIGLIVEYGAFRMSMVGDAETREWAWLRSYQRELLTPVQVHKASHHGSVHGDAVAALALLMPSTVIVSVGAGNSYGLPDAAALARYQAHNAAVFRTDQVGTVVVEAQRSGEYTVTATAR